MHELEITGVRFEGRVHRGQLEELLAALQKESRRRDVAAVTGTIRLAPELTIQVEVQERGARLKVPGRGVYACSVDGLLNAVADVIREEHAADPALLDVYQRLLETS